MYSASIIIPTLNEEKYLPNLLSSLKSVKIPLDIIVVDGMSEDSTKQVVERFMPAFSGESSLRFVQANQRGISFQRNLGASLARYNTLIFCDADIVFVTPESYETIVAEFVTKTYAASAPRMTSWEPEFKFNVIYTLVYYAQKMLLLFKRPYFAGSCLLTTKTVFTNVGGFDTAVLLGEDVDYSLKASQVGHCGLIEVPIKVSARRVIKYGYWWLIKELPNVTQFAFTGKIKDPERLFYPFGDFGDLNRKNTKEKDPVPYAAKFLEDKPAEDREEHVTAEKKE